jgi:glycosyltransferase involved in cell wall biosynthesis
MPRISVVIPTLNRSALLARAVDSLPGSTSEEIEIIVVDDGSIDDTEAVVSRLGSKIRFLQQDHLGPGAARNLGWNAATGDYVAFLDSDDVWFPWTLPVYLDVLQRFHFPSLIVGTGAWFRDDSDLANIRPEAVGSNVFTDYLASARIPIWLGASAMLVKRDCQAKFEVIDMNAEDLDFALHLGQAPGFIWIQKPFTFGYRRHDATAVMNLEKTLIGIKHLVEEEQTGRYPGGSERRTERIQLITRAVRPPVIEALRQRKWRDAFSLYKRTFGWHLLLKRFRFLVAVPFLGLLFALRRRTR